MVIKTYSDYLEHLKQGLIKTHDGDKSIKYLVDTLRKLKFNVTGDYDNNIISLTIKDFNHIASNKLDDFFNTISSILTNKFGWYPSSMDIHLLSGLDRLKKYDEAEIKLKRSIIGSLTIKYDSKFGNKVFYNGYLYHLSIREYEKKILKKGLFPKSKSKLSSHLDRVYLCKNLNDCKNLIHQMKIHYSEERDVNFYDLGNKKWRKDTRWIIFKINNSSINLYKDNNYGEGHYTMDNIDPKDITIIDKED